VGWGGIEVGHDLGEFSLVCNRERLGGMIDAPKRHSEEPEIN
jgi:hypothetical protein